MAVSAYPPYYWYPPGYVAGGALLGFAAGIIIGSALWGNCIWGGPVGVNINVNRYNNFNRTNISNGNWNHRVEHRGGVRAGGARGEGGSWRPALRTAGSVVDEAGSSR